MALTSAVNTTNKENPNLRKAAILLTCLPRSVAAKLMAKFTPAQVETVSIEIAYLGRVSVDEQNTVINEFADSSGAAFGGMSGNLELARNLINEALGDGAKESFENVRQVVESLPFSFLKKIDPQSILTFIADEHPQTIALILTYLPPAYGAEILAGLQPDRQLAVIRRIANMGQTSPEVIRSVEKGLEFRMANLMSQSFDKTGGVGSIAEILNITDRTTERTIMDQLSRESPELVEEIRRLMFVFEDIAKLGDKDIQQILKNVDGGKWAMALKGCSEAMKQKILGNMSQRAAQTLQEEIEFLGAVKLSDVEKVQQEIVDIVRSLEDSGAIAPRGNGEKEEMVA
ncbi:MAG: flagellar motor switch protein FliG [Planctomycetaceae bacterium]|nr:flagellar motor switch protein FliG [Planctomycetaceae bacterium]